MQRGGTLAKVSPDCTDSARRKSRGGDGIVTRPSPWTGSLAAFASEALLLVSRGDGPMPIAMRLSL